MEWRQYIHSDPQILMGKPVVRGTRLSVEFLLGLMANGWTQDQILTEYPVLQRPALAAVLACAADSLQEMSFHSLTPTSP